MQRAMSRILHFTIGPVQSFVEQARRTSDLWAGSFLLSWLSGQAMKGVEDAGGTVIFPKIKDDPLFKAITQGTSATGPAVGSLPNRFKARVPDDFDAKLCRQAALDAWRGLADKVWSAVVQPAEAHGHGTRDIWNRQVGGFWEMAWVIGTDPGTGSDHTWLDRRKNWRTHRPTVEPGDHCMLMGDWQELSGFVRARKRQQQDEFWRALRDQVVKKTHNPLSLDENERLCAMALIKRLFLSYAKDVLGWTPSWKGVAVKWPSTPRLAATGWLKYTWQHANAEARSYVAVAKDTKGKLPEPEVEPGNELSTVAGHLLHPSGIEYAHEDELGSVSRDALREAYKSLRNRVEEPSAFYALLLMDGDQVGRLLRERGEDAVSKGLSRFAGKVDDILREHDGHTVYAGGDDVLALLPLEGALPAALALHEAYRAAFDNDQGATISGALVFAHFHVPLRHVLREAHRQLDDVAKEENGRDSLAVCVLTQGGVTRRWVSTWCDPDQTFGPPAELADFAKIVEADASSRFFYAFEDRYRGILIGGPHDILPDAGDLKKILQAEYRHSGAAERRQGESEEEQAARIKDYVDRLMRLVRPHAKPESPREQTAPLVSMEGPLIARFLAQKTRWPGAEA